MNTMILINYIKPDIVIYSDELISGEVEIWSMTGIRIYKEKFIRQSFIDISIDLEKFKNIKVVLKTEEENIQKIFQTK